MQPVAPLDELEQEERRAVRPPVHRLDRAREVERQVDRARRVRASQVAGRRSPVRSWVIAIRLSPASGEKREPGQRQARRRAARPRSRRSTASIDAQRRVEHVAVLHDLEDDDRLVAREGAPVDRAVRPQPPASRTGSGCSWMRRATPPCSAVQTENPSSVLSAATVRVRPIASPSVQPLGSPSIERLRRDVLVERRDHVGAGLGAGLVVEPDRRRCRRASAGPRARRPGRR